MIGNRREALHRPSIPQQTLSESSDPRLIRLIEERDRLEAIMSAQREPGLRQSAECFTAKAKRPPHMTLDKSDPKRQRMTRAQRAKDIAIKPIIATCVDTRAAVAVDGMQPAPAVLDAAIRTQQCEILPAASPSAPTEQIPSQPYSRLLRLP